jgi:hypothetical protein
MFKKRENILERFNGCWINLIVTERKRQPQIKKLFIKSTYMKESGYQLDITGIGIHEIGKPRSIEDFNTKIRMDYSDNYENAPRGSKRDPKILSNCVIEIEYVNINDYDKYLLIKETERKYRYI